MITDLIVLQVSDTMADAYQKMQSYGIRHLPVVDENNEIVGIFTMTDLQRAYSPRQTESGWFYDKAELCLLNLAHFMNRSALTLTPEDSLKQAAEIMVRNKYSCIPIVAPGTRRLIGIITYIDLLKKIESLF